MVQFYYKGLHACFPVPLQLYCWSSKDVLDQVIEESDLSSTADIMKEWEVSELATALGEAQLQVHKGEVKSGLYAATYIAICRDTVEQLMRA